VLVLGVEDEEGWGRFQVVRGFRDPEVLLEGVERVA
jgi:hypothetical protein